MLGILKVAQRMIAAGLDEKEVAAGLVNFLKTKYNLADGETYHDSKSLAGECQSARIVCKNTK